jgi:hypothetical protein
MRATPPNSRPAAASPKRPGSMAKCALDTGQLRLLYGWHSIGGLDYEISPGGAPSAAGERCSHCSHSLSLKRTKCGHLAGLLWG